MTGSDPRFKIDHDSVTIARRRDVDIAQSSLELTRFESGQMTFVNVLTPEDGLCSPGRRAPLVTTAVVLSVAATVGPDDGVVSTDVESIVTIDVTRTQVGVIGAGSRWLAIARALRIELGERAGIVSA